MEDGFAGPAAKTMARPADGDDAEEEDDGLKTYFLEDVITWPTISSLMRHDSFMSTYTINTAEDKTYVGSLLTAAGTDFDAIYNIADPAPVDLS